MALHAYVDGTFTVVPRPFYQFVTIFVSVLGKVLPAIHVLMTELGRNQGKRLLLPLLLGSLPKIIKSKLLGCPLF